MNRTAGKASATQQAQQRMTKQLAHHPSPTRRTRARLESEDLSRRLNRVARCLDIAGKKLAIIVHRPQKKGVVPNMKNDAFAFGN
jgi:CBS-domain-containing membrane protein